jgi:predicted secreted hydrolase
MHDLPHESSRVEWWYLNAHLTTADHPFSLFAAFFTVDISDRADDRKQDSHFLTWALTDVDGRRYFPEALLDPRSPEIAVAELDAARGPRDPRLAQALREVVAAGRIPLPDRLLTAPARVPHDRLALDFDGNRLTKRPDGRYELDLAAHGGRTGCRLRFTLETPVVRHGDDGIVRGLKGENMFYYFSPRCRVEGSLLVDGAWQDVADGSGWYDHEFGDNQRLGYGYQATVGWNWLAAQLDNGYAISAYDMFDRDDTARSRGRWVIVTSRSGERCASTISPSPATRTGPAPRHSISTQLAIASRSHEPASCSTSTLRWRRRRWSLSSRRRAFGRDASACAARFAVGWSLASASSSAAARASSIRRTNSCRRSGERHGGQSMSCCLNVRHASRPSD